MSMAGGLYGLDLGCHAEIERFVVHFALFDCDSRHVQVSAGFPEVTHTVGNIASCRYFALQLLPRQ